MGKLTLRFTRGERQQPSNIHDLHFTRQFG